MMLEACSQYWLPLLLAAIIGLITAWWIWGGHKSSATTVSGDSKVGDAAMAAAAANATLPDADKSTMPPEATMADVTGPDGVAPVAAVAATAAAAAVPLMAMAKTPRAKAAATKKAAVKKPVAEKSAPKKLAAKKPAVAAKDTAPAAKKMATKTAAAKIAAPKPIASKTSTAKTMAKPKIKPKIIIPDNLEFLKGVGPKLNALLKSHGVTSFEQIANWSAADIREIDSKLGSFAGRIGRDNWVDQAKLLVKGDTAAFEKKYGSLGSEINRG